MQEKRKLAESAVATLEKEFDGRLPHVVSVLQGSIQKLTANELAYLAYEIYCAYCNIKLKIGPSIGHEHMQKFPNEILQFFLIAADQKLEEVQAFKKLKAA